MSTFSTRLREAIKLRGVTQAWVARNAATTEATISRYLTSERDPAIIDILSNIAKVLDVSSDYLIGMSDVPHAQDKSQVLPFEKELLLKCYSNISESDAAVIWTLLDKYMTPQEREKLMNSFRRETIRIG